MTTYTATEAKNRFGEIIDAAQRNAVLIEKKGRAYAYILSKEEYDFKQRLEDEYWIKQAEEGEKSGFIGEKETEAFFAKFRKSSDRGVRKHAKKGPVKKSFKVSARSTIKTHKSNRKKNR